MGSACVRACCCQPSQAPARQVVTVKTAACDLSVHISPQGCDAGRLLRTGGGAPPVCSGDGYEQTAALIFFWRPCSDDILVGQDPTGHVTPHYVLCHCALAVLCKHHPASFRVKCHRNGHNCTRVQCLCGLRKPLK